MNRYDTDPRFARCVDDMMDLLHEPQRYEWVNTEAIIAFNAAMGYTHENGKFLALNELTQDHPNYQVFVDYQVSFLGDIIAGMQRRHHNV